MGVWVLLFFIHNTFHTPTQSHSICPLHHIYNPCPLHIIHPIPTHHRNASTAKGFSGKPPPSSSTPTPPPSPTPPASTADRKWRLKAYDVEEWITWVNTQKEAANVKGENVWIQVQLDGTVRSSGVGMPPWVKFVADLPELSDVRTKITDGMGRL